MMKITRTLRGRRGARARLPKTAAPGFKKGAPSKFMEDPVKRRLFDQTIIEVHEVFAAMPTADELENLIDEAVASVRKEIREVNLMSNEWPRSQFDKCDFWLQMRSSAPRDAPASPAPHFGSPLRR
jgi:hypothetical protein